MDPQAVFKAYDVRCRSDTGEVDEALYKAIGRAVVEVLDADILAIGRDCRATSERFATALSDGVTGSGGNVVDLGEVPTDAVYFYSGSQRVHGAIVTASHNPPEYNGLKLCGPGAAPIGAETGLEDVKRAVLSSTDASEDDRPTGTVARADIVADYVDHLFDIVPASSIGALAVAVDGGNGMAGVALGDVFARIDADLTGLYIEPDGTFPNHPADPLIPENLVDLQALMDKDSFDLGVAFDGDADRAFFLDDRGAPLSGSTITSLVAARVLEDHPGASIVHNLITSKAVPELVTERGGNPIRTRVGHSYIKQVMAETGAMFGGEHSGHYYFAENYRADSGMLAMLYLLRIVSDDGRPLSEIRRDVERYAGSGEINFVVSDPLATMAKVEDRFSSAVVDHLDGLTVDLGDAWFNLRPSNTEPLLRLNAEASDDASVTHLVKRVRDIVEAEA